VNLKLKNMFLAAIAIAVGVIVLLGYFIALLADLRALLLRWAVILTGVMLFVGVVNLALVHWRKARAQQPGSFYSLVLLASLAITFVIGIFGPTKPGARWIFDYIQVPIESSLMAILAVILVYASARLLRRRLDFFSLVFVATVFLVMIGTVALPGINSPIFYNVRTWIMQIPVIAGARGILLGVGRGTIATGLRSRMGAGRP